MDDNMEMQFQDIMEFVAGEASGDERREATMIQFDDEQKLPARIKVIGEIRNASRGVSFSCHAVNKTDVQLGRPQRG